VYRATYDFYKFVIFKFRLTAEQALALVFLFSDDIEVPLKKLIQFFVFTIFKF
jgi:hypothetical protein